MSNKGAESNQQAAQRRAESYYLLYAALGHDRSLSKLRETLADLGLSVSLNTLKSYSANYDWQGRAGFLDQRNTSLEHANLPAEMNERHARLGIALQTVAGKRLETIDASELSVGDAPRLAKAGVDIERLATGQANERYELVASMLSPMIYDSELRRGQRGLAATRIRLRRGPRVCGERVPRLGAKGRRLLRHHGFQYPGPGWEGPGSGGHLGYACRPGGDAGAGCCDTGSLVAMAGDGWHLRPGYVLAGSGDCYRGNGVCHRGLPRRTPVRQRCAHRVLNLLGIDAAGHRRGMGLPALAPRPSLLPFDSREGF